MPSCRPARGGAPPRSGRARAPAPRSRPRLPLAQPIVAASCTCRRRRLMHLLTTGQVIGQLAARLLLVRVGPLRFGSRRCGRRSLAPRVRRRSWQKIEELRRQLVAKDALLAEREAELAAAKAGLVVKALEAEKLKTG